MHERDRFRATAAHNETWHHDHTARPTPVGDRPRLACLLYQGDPPADPRNG